jgi:hypothetical protein
MINRKFLIAGAVVASVITIACSETTGPTQLAPGASESAKSGTLHLTKECSEYAGQAGDHCTVIKSNFKQIAAGARVYYLSPADLEHASYDGPVELRVRPGDVAFGHCSVSNIFATLAHTFLGHCSFSGGTGQFDGFHAEIVVTVGHDPIWADWNGPYSFSARN